MKFSILEVAVAPVVLGLGIDYSIHLQRGYEKARSSSKSAAEAWVQSFDSIRVALMLAVVTTVFAFMSNSFSPLPPPKDVRGDSRTGSCFGIYCEHNNCGGGSCRSREE